MSTTTQPMTVAELEQNGAPEGRWELVDGELVEVSPAGGIASKVALWIGHLLTGHVIPRGLGEVFGADGGFVLFPGQQTVRVPDIAFVRTERLPPEDEQVGFLRLAPDLVVEVISPTDRRTEIEAKIQMYLEAGVRLIWLVDPRARTVAVYAPDQVVQILHGEDQLDGGAVVPGFTMSVTALFRWSPRNSFT